MKSYAITERILWRRLHVRDFHSNNRYMTELSYFPNVMLHDGTLAYGGSQKWFHLLWRRLSGCAAVSATNLAAYYEIGLQPEGRYSFGNNVLFVTDVGQDGDNVLLDDERRLRFIDPIIGFKQSLLNLLTAALEDESNVNELIFAIHGVAKPEQKGIVSQ